MHELTGLIENARRRVALGVILAGCLMLLVSNQLAPAADPPPRSIFDDLSLPAAKSKNETPSAPARNDTPAPAKNDTPPATGKNDTPPATPANPVPPPVRNDGPPLMVVPPGGFDWAAYVANSASIEMTVFKPIPFVEGKNDQNWVEAPEGIKRFPMVFFSDYGQEKGVADFKVTRSGLLVLACDYSNQGNKGGNWTQTRLKRADFVARGWTYLSPEQMGGALGMLYYDKKRHNYDVFVKAVKEGETYSLRCNKYYPPFAILPMAKVPGAVAGSAANPVNPPPGPAAVPTPAPAVAPAPAVVAAPAAAPPPPSRRAIPAKDDLARSKALLNDLFAVQMRDQTLAGRKKLAVTLLDEVPKNASNPSDQYVILAGALGAARESADLRLCFRVADIMADQYQIDGFTVKTDTALKGHLKGDSGATTAENINAALELIDPLVAAEEFETAAKILAQARAAAGSDRVLKPLIQSRAQELEAARAAHGRLAPSMAKLKTAPDDPAANLAVGSFFCFTKGDWQKGLPMLAKSSDAGLKPLAIQELSSPTEPDAVMRLADGWWDVSAKEAADSRAAIRQHAASLYTTLLGDATGLQRALLEHRIAEAQTKATSPTTDEKKATSASLARIVGRWTLRFTNGAVRTYVFHPDGDVDFVGSGFVAHPRQDGDAWILDFADGKLERLTIVDDKLQIDHFEPASDFPNGKPRFTATGNRSQGK